MKKAELDQKHTERIKNEQIELEEKAKNGDPSARMRLAKPNSKEYWEAYQQYEIDYSNKWETKTIRLINEISVFEEDFAEKVVSSIEVEKKIYSHLIPGKHTTVL